MVIDYLSLSRTFLHYLLLATEKLHFVQTVLVYSNRKVFQNKAPYCISDEIILRQTLTMSPFPIPILCPFERHENLVDFYPNSSPFPEEKTMRGD